MAKRGVVVWLTGLPCSGKTTIAMALKKRLGSRALHLDGDELRQELSSDLGFSPEERSAHLKRVRGVAQVGIRQGYVVVCSFVSPSRAVRQELRDKLKRFVEVFVDAPQSVCIERDVKGMWKEAINGDRTNFTGYDAEYEEPLDPELTIKTDETTLTKAANILVNYLTEQGYV